jgi:Cell division protein FtsI/penicillin-binding protein 2
VRSTIIGLVCVAAWVAIIRQLFVLQIVDYDQYQTKVLDNIQRETTLTAERGIIYDRNMVQLATNYTVYRVFISPRDIIDDAQAKLIANGLVELLGVDYNEVIDRAGRTGRADETIKKNVSEEDADKVLEFITANDLDSQIHLEASTSRYYPYNSLAAQVIGLVGTDGGLLGLELEYNDYLSGSSGRYLTARNAYGLSMPYKYDTYIDASNGANLVTTIDLTLQSMLEKELEKTYIDSAPLNRVTGVVLNPKTGAVLAMATYPSFNLNDPYTLTDEYQKKLDESGYAVGSDEYKALYTTLLYSMWKNKAVSELYEPGSTFKIITSAAALEENVVKFTDMFTCTGSFYVEGYSKPIHCWKTSGHGTISFEVGLQQSCNPTLMQVAARLGREKFYEYFKAFGYTEKTGIDLPGEANSYYHAYSGFNQVELAVYSFGQTFKVTPLQQLTGICTVANGGYLVTPYVVEKLVDDDGNVLMSHKTDVKRQVVSTEVCTEVTDVLERGVSGNGGAKNAYVAGYKVAAKTGTSEVRDILDENGNSYLRVGSCVAYAPSDDPQIAVIIVVDQPQNGGVFGSVIAAPYVSSFLNEALPYLGVERNYTDEDLARIAVTVGDYVGKSVGDAKTLVNTLGVDVEVKGDGSTVTYQMPTSGESINKDTGKIILYCGDETPTDTVTVPNVMNMSATNCNQTLLNYGLNILIDGTTNYDIASGAVVIAQEPASGTVVPSGTVVTVTLRYLDSEEN